MRVTTEKHSSCDAEKKKREDECFWCGETYQLDVFEIWGDREFQLETCCLGSWEEAVRLLNEDSEDGDAFREHCSELVGEWVPCRQVYASESRQQIVIDRGLTIRPIRRKEAKAFIREHHRHNPPPAGDRFRFGCFNGSELIAVAMVGRPVARMIDHEKVVEVNRLCVNHELDRELTWKACSLMYTHAADEARERGFERIITYTLETESGMSLRYARWKKEHTTRGGSWNRKSRPRTDKAPTCPKVRWAKELVA